MTLAAGKLDHRLTLVRDSGVSYGSRGESHFVREEVATVWADIEPLNGTETELAHQLSPLATVRVTIRYSTLVDTISPGAWFEGSDRLGNTRKLQISQIIEPRERRERFSVLCSETLLEEALASS